MQWPTCASPITDSDTSCPECGLLLESEPTVAYVPIHVAQHPALTPDEASALGGIHGYALVVGRGPRAGMTFLISEGATTVGRHPDSDIFLDDVTVSRRHAELTHADGVYRVRDVGSLNGTYLNRERIDEAPLADGDELQIGKFKLVFFAAGE